MALSWKQRCTVTENPFRKAIDVLHERGWATGAAVRLATARVNGITVSTGVCVLGALGLACGIGLDDIEDEAYTETPEMTVLADVIFEQSGLHAGGNDADRCWQFNDRVAESASDIETMLDKAAVRWDERI